MASKLTDLANQKTAMQLQTMSKEAYQWLLLKIQDIRRPTSIPIGINREATIRKISRVVKGKLFCFYYDPKGKADLPYYDRFPLVLPLKRESDGFIGLNIHYLPIRYRVAFMRKLMPLALFNDDDEIRRIRITYPILDASNRLKEFRPCIKKYLYTHIKSRILKVEGKEWDIAMYLPVQQFKKVPVNTVWRDSIQEIRTS